METFATVYISQVLEIARLFQSNLTLTCVCRRYFGLLLLVSSCFEHVSNNKIDQSRVTPTLCSADHHAQKWSCIWYWKTYLYHYKGIWKCPLFLFFSFFQNIFPSRKFYICWWDFFKFISSSKRIAQKLFQNDSSSLKIQKV